MPSLHSLLTGGTGGPAAVSAGSDVRYPVATGCAETLFSGFGFQAANKRSI